MCAYKRTSAIPCNEGGTGQITNTIHGILLGQGTNPITSQTLTNGQILIGSTGDPVASTLTEGANIDIVNAAGAITVAVDDELTGITSITTNNAGSIQTGVVAGNTTLLKAYDTDDLTYRTFATLTANAIPTMDLNTAVTIDNAYIYRVGGNDVSVVDGGTGNSSMAAYAVVCGGTTTINPLQSVASLGVAGQVLTSAGAGALPTWQNAPVSGIQTLNGDTGSATGATVTLNANTNSGSSVKFTGAGATVSLSVTDANDNTFIGLNAGNSTGTGSANVAVGELAMHFFDIGGSQNVAFGQSSLYHCTSGNHNTAIGDAALANVHTGAYNIGIGPSAGTNYNTSESANILIGNTGTTGESHIIRIGDTGSGVGQQNSCYIAGINGVNVGSVASVLTNSGDHLGTATITAGSGISVTPGANTITIENTSTRISWSVVTVDATFTVNTGTIANKAGLLTMTLPATAAIGDTIEITNMNTAVGWRIAQNANQYIRYGNSLTTTGAAGYLEATALGNSVRIVCMVAGTSTGWIVVSAVGNLTRV